MGLYYLQSRYYDANIGRFISADGYVSTGQGIIGNNMYAYCGNNPIMRSDRGGAARGYESLDQDGKSMLEDPYFGIDSAYYNYQVYSKTAAYDARLGGYYYSGGGSIGGYTSNFAIGFPGSVTVTDDMVKKQSTSRSLYNLDGDKNQKYLDKRHWDKDMIEKAINNGKKGTSINAANGKPCTVYRYPGTQNQYVVIENKTRNIVQVSDFLDQGWKPDGRIVWDP